MTRSVQTTAALHLSSAVVLACAMAGTLPAQEAQPKPRTGRVTSSRSFSPIVEDVDAAMRLYAALGSRCRPRRMAPYILAACVSAPQQAAGRVILLG